MQRVTFYTGVAKRETFVCRLVATAYNQSNKLIILLPNQADLDQLDKALWTYQDNSFLAHDSWEQGADFPMHSPIVLTLSLANLPEKNIPTTVLNLSENMCNYSFVERVLEIISTDSQEISVARQRFRGYKEAGFQVEHHDMSQKN